MLKARSLTLQHIYFLFEISGMIGFPCIQKQKSTWGNLHGKNKQRNVFCVDYRLPHTTLEKLETCKKIEKSITCFTLKAS